MESNLSNILSNATARKCLALQIYSADAHYRTVQGPWPFLVYMFSVERHTDCAEEQSSISVVGCGGMDGDVKAWNHLRGVPEPY
jgi:hypothetical protein